MVTTTFSLEIKSGFKTVSKKKTHDWVLWPLQVTGYDGTP
jgi:hypothetical protein